MTTVRNVHGRFTLKLNSYSRRMQHYCARWQHYGVTGPTMGAHDTMIGLTPNSYCWTPSDGTVG